MAQTHEGAAKVAAQRCGITLETYTANVAAGLKHCMKCREWKPRADFNRDTSRYDGLNASCQACTRVKVRVSTKGRPSVFKGRTHTPTARAAMSAARKGKPNPHRVGTKHTPETRKRMSEVTKARTPRGEAHYAFSHGEHQRDRDARRTTEYKAWRDAVYARDNYACQDCGDNKGGNLQAHHIQSFADHPDLRFVVSNGTTLCRDCHERLHLKPIPGFKCRRKKHPHPPTPDQ